MHSSSQSGGPGLRPWALLDGAVIFYTALTALLVIIFYENIPNPLPILVLHALVISFVLVLPPRGARWETATNDPLWRYILRGGARFLRYAYPLLLVVLYFEEVQQTVNAIAPHAPYWFEPKLYAADRWVFGKLPALLLSNWVGLIQNEILHAFYFSYYFILIGGVIIAWFGPKETTRQPGLGFESAVTSMTLAFFLSFIWYPWLPARGPWENPELMARLPEFEGILFTPIVEWIIARGAVSGGCFPSSHVAGSWGIVLGLAAYHRRAAAVLGFFAVGMSVACVYTRYHHAVDVPAGLLAGVLGAWIGRRFSRRHAVDRLGLSYARKESSMSQEDKRERDASLREHLVKLLTGGQAHVDFETAVEKLSPEHQGKRPPGAPHSPWQLLEHVRIAQWDILEFTRNPQHASPNWPEGYWPEQATPPQPGSWERSLAGFRSDLDSFRQLVENPATDLFAPIAGGTGQTLLREAMLLADHNAYHMGQLVLVRRLLEAW